MILTDRFRLWVGLAAFVLAAGCRGEKKAEAAAGSEAPAPAAPSLGSDTLRHDSTLARDTARDGPARNPGSETPVLPFPPAPGRAPAGAGATDTVTPAESLMPEFPWPPPRFTTRYVLPPRLLLGPGATLGEVFDHLNAALERAGEGERSVYSIRRTGFAVVARLESIENDGRPKAGQARWQADSPHGGAFSLSAYLREIFKAQPGRYRVIVFVVTNLPVVPGAKRPTADEMNEALEGGAGNLSGDIRSRSAVGANYEALIYEFFRASNASPTKLVEQSAISPAQHLTGAGLWSVEDLRQ